ncbi:hypothetical protein ACFWIO_18910 [Streptomyces diastatochromogenes]
MDWMFGGLTTAEIMNWIGNIFKRKREKLGEIIRTRQESLARRCPNAFR